MKIFTINQLQLRSRKPLTVLAQQLTASNININSKWQMIWTDGTSPVVRNLINPIIKTRWL